MRHWREVADALEVDPELGLSQAEAARRLVERGPNELAPPERPSLPAIVWESATEPFVLMLFAAGVLAVMLGELRDGLLVLAGLVPIVGADAVTGYRAERALEALRAASAPRARVRRDGTPIEIHARETVVGDLLLLSTGDVVAADGRVVSAHGALVDRSVLTGESLPEPVAAAPDPDESSLADRRCMVYAGTSVVGGTVEAVVVATAADTEMGRISGALRPEVRRRSPIQAELDRLVRLLLVAAVSLIVITLGLGFVRGNPAGANLLAGISAAIAAIPEEPPVLLAVILGLGAYRLLRKGVLVRRLNAQETLGAVDLILTDKTGTLTRNRLEVASVLMPEGEVPTGSNRSALLQDALRSEADAWQAARVGSAGAFPSAIRGTLEADGHVLELDVRDLIACEPATEGHPYSLVVYRTDVGSRSLVSGAPETVLDLAGEDGPSDQSKNDWRRLTADEAGRGSRLLLLAERAGDAPWRPLALLAFRDLLRPDIGDAMTTATKAGIQTIMVTGDHPSTASTIAAEAGMPEGRVATGADLARWDDRELRAQLPSLQVVARATPDDKLRLVNAARESDRTVAVTGDGVNDAPALHRADVAVAMGSGTAVAREAADLVLGDDSFATLMDGLREGRRIIANVQKGLVFLVSTHVALLGFVLLGTIAGFGQPLLPIQILWAELFIDVATSIAFEREPEEPGAMLRPPRPRGSPLLDRGILSGVALAGGFSAFAALLLMFIPDGGDHARWVAFTALAVGQVIRANANRSLLVPVYRLPINGFLVAAVLLVIAFQAAIPYLAPLASAFRATPLDATEWALVAGVALAPAVVAQVARARGRRWVA